MSGFIVSKALTVELFADILSVSVTIVSVILVPMREHQKALYTAMMLSGTLNTHLEEVDHTANEMYDRLTSQLAEQEGITEHLKAACQMEWVQQMNNIRNRTAEVVWKELIYV